MDLTITKVLDYRADVELTRIDLLTDGATTRLEGNVDLSGFPEMSYTLESDIDLARVREIFFAVDDFTAASFSRFRGMFHKFEGGHELRRSCCRTRSRTSTAAWSSSGAASGSTSWWLRWARVPSSSVGGPGWTALARRAGDHRNRSRHAAADSRGVPVERRRRPAAARHAGPAKPGTPDEVIQDIYIHTLSSPAHRLDTAAVADRRRYARLPPRNGGGRQPGNATERRPSQRERSGRRTRRRHPPPSSANTSARTPAQGRAGTGVSLPFTL